MADAIKFKPEELKELTDLRQGYVDTQNQLGRLSVQKVLAEQQYESLTKAEDELKQNYLNLTTKEQELVQKYNEQYGIGTVNIDTGEFLPAEAGEKTEESAGTPTPSETAEKVSEKK